MSPVRFKVNSKKGGGHNITDTYILRMLVV